MAEKKIVVGGDKDFITEMTGALSGAGLLVAGATVSPGDLVSAIDQNAPLGAVVPGDPSWIETIIQLSKARPKVTFFVAGVSNRNDWARLQDDQVTSVSKEPTKAAKSILMCLEKVSPTAFVPSNEQVIVRTEPLQLLSKVIVPCFSPKGGVGKTTICVSLATVTGMWCAKQGKFRVAVIDNNLDGVLENHFGCHLYLGDNPPQRPITLAEFQNVPKGASFAEVSRCMNYHEQSNVHFLACPGSMYQKKSLNPEMVGHCLDVLSKHFDFIFVDMGAHLDDIASLEAVERATDVVLVLNHDPLTISMARRRVPEMKHFLNNFERTILVQNQDRLEFPLVDPADLAALFGIPVTAQIPYCEIEIKALQSAVPAVYMAPGDPFSLEIAKLTRRVLGTQALELVPQVQKERQPSLFSRLFRGRRAS